jgi:phage minor structural protein
MILYFADRKMNIIGQASTSLPNGLTVYDDLKVEDIESGVASFECRIPYDKKTRTEVENMAAVGNYILRSNGDENEFYTIIESEGNTRDSEVFVYAEDAGLDLLNEVFGDYAADKAYPISHYVNMFIYDTGFEIGLNEIPNLTRKLSWEGEATGTERLASAATQFDGCEISYSFKVENLTITHKYVNIHKKRGKDAGVQLRLNYEVDRIITKQSIANLATALYCKGGTPEDENPDDNIEPVPITLNGYKYDDGDFYVDGHLLKSRTAGKKWTRYIWNKEPNKLQGDEGYIVRQYEYDTLSQSELCAHAITELKKAREIEVNYEVDINRLPKGVKVGDTVYIVDDAIGLYVSARILMLETSVVDQEQKATIGEYLIKNDGIAQKVYDLAAKFAVISISAQRAKEIARNAQNVANGANTQAQGALQSAQEAQAEAEQARVASETATQSAQQAEAKAEEAKQAVEGVQQAVAGMEQTIADAEAAAEQARQAAETAQTKAEEAHTASVNAGQQAQTAEQKANEAQTKAEEATTKAEEAKTTADTAKQQAVDAATEAQAAKQDAQKAQEDINALGDNLTTLEETMQADYSRKTDLTEAEAHLQAQITKNAAEIASNLSKIQIIDETTNNAAEKAEQAQTTAQQAQAEAEQAQAEATAAQTKADEAKTAAQNAQNEADTAKTAAQTAKQVADKAKDDLEAAQADLATLQGRADATEADILAAQQKVNEAQAAANKAQSDADTATQKATSAQEAADKAVTDAENAQTKADEASAQASAAQQVANEAKGNAEQAQAIANEAKETAQQAQATANVAKTNATNAQTVADQAKADALTAQQAADEADAKAQQAQADLTEAQQNLANVTSRIDATEEEVEKAKADVATAQEAADKAKADAITAQQTADTAKANAQNAQNAADQAQAKADEAQQAADDAQAAADKAQADVDALAVRVTKTETDIVQTSEQIKLLATKEEVTQTLGGYYTKTESDANLTLKANEINASVTQKIAEIEVGGRNIAQGTSDEWTDVVVGAWSGELRHAINGVLEFRHEYTEYGVDEGDWLTFGIDLKAINKPIAIRVDVCPNMQESGIHKYGNYIAVGKEGRSVVKIQVDSNNPIVKVYVGTDGTNSESTTEQYKAFKIEKGNKATDWTPAPEDVDADINEVSSDLHAEVVEQTTQILAECDKMLFSALESYVDTGDYESFKESIQSQLAILTDNITMTFTQTQEALNDIDKDLQEKFNQVTTYFTFDIDGLIIGKTDNPYKMVLTNERYSMTVNDEEVMYIDAITKMAYFPKLTITDAFVLLGYEWKHVEVDGLVIVDWIGGA